MEQNPPRPMTPFDELVTPPGLYTLKLMLPYTPPSIQRIMGIYIKFLELKSALEQFQGFPRKEAGASILEDLKEYMGPEEREQMEQMEGLMNMMDMMDLMKGAFDNE